METETEFVMVPVPRERVLDVMALLTGGGGSALPPPPRGREPRGGGLGGDESDESRKAEWSETLLRRCWQESPASMQAVLGLLADRAPDFVPITEIAEAAYADGSRRKFAGALGAFTKRCEKRYNATTWPFSGPVWSHELGMWQYSMPGWVAEIVRGLRD